MSSQAKSAPEAAAKPATTNTTSAAGATKSKGINTNQLIETVQVCIQNVIIKKE